jgi:Flp pilus assembly protein TadB
MKESQTNNDMQARSTRDLIQEIIGDVQEIMRSEIRLAKTELKEEGAKAGKAGGFAATGGMLAFFGVALLEGMCVVLLAMLMPLWIAFLVMAVISLCAGGIFFFAARDKWRAFHPAQKTVASLREDLEWAKQQTR